MERINTLTRELSGVYFRIRRNDKFVTVDFTDMTEEEQIEILKEKDIEWLQRMCLLLTRIIKELGDQFDLERKLP